MSPATILEDTTTPMVLPMRPPYSLVRRPGKPVDAVERGSLVALGKGGVIEHRINKVVQCTAERHNSLADVQQFAGALADDVHAQQVSCLAMENDLQASGGMAADLSPGGLAIISDAYFVGHVFIGELFLRLADKRNLRDRINPIGVVARIGYQVFV